MIGNDGKLRLACFKNFTSERSEPKIDCIARKNKLECPKSDIVRPEINMENADAITEEEEIKPCLNCMAPNPESAAVCSECGASFFGANNLVPTNVIRS